MNYSYLLLIIINGVEFKLFRKFYFKKKGADLGLNFYYLEKNLNLLDKISLIKICQKLNIKKFKIIKFKFLLFTSNLILVIKKY